MTHFASCVVLTLCALIYPQLVQSQSTYPVDFSVVPDTQPIAVRTSGVELGPCICDLTFGECDVNCACDSNCNDAEKASFSGKDIEGPRDPRVFTCVDPALIDINKRGNMLTTAVDNLLCVAVDNNPSKGYFFNDPGVPSAADLDRLRVSSSNALFQPTVIPTLNGNQANYKVDDVLTGGSVISGAFALTNGGVFRLPNRDLAGRCNDRSSVLFRRDISESDCLRTAAALSTTCAAGFDANAYTTVLRVGSVRTATIASQFVTVTVASISFLDANTGVTTSIAGTTIPAPVYTVGTRECRNVLSKLILRLSYTDAGVVTAASAFVTLTSAFGTTSDTAAWKQTFAAVWNSVTARPKSGNPGYRIGLPVLVGDVTVQGTKTAISQYVDGLTVLPHLADLSCDGNNNSSASRRYNVLFGHDSLFSCSSSYNLAALSAVCLTGLPATVFGLAGSHFAQFGNASFTISSQWSPFTVVARSLPPPATSWDATTRTCTVQNALNLEFYYSELGAKNNAQSRIAAARVSFGTTKWQFTLDDPTAAQKFPVFSSVSFLRIPSAGIVDVTPPRLPLFPELPRDVLYPLYIDDSSAHLTRVSFCSSIVTVLALWLAICFTF